MAVYEYPMYAYNRVQATLRVTVTEPSDKISVANNTSVLHVTMQLINNNNTPSHNANCTIYLDVNGSRVYTGSSFDIRGGVTQTFYDQDVTISHNTAGDASVPIYAYFKSGVSIGTAEISQTFVCTTIPRKTDVSLSASSAYFGNSITIYCAKKSSSFTNKLYYKVNSGSWNVLNANAGNSMAWTIPMSLIANIPNDMSCTITVNVDTYNGSTFIGSSSAKITVNVPSSARTAPSLNKTDIYLRDGTVGITLSPYAGTWQHKIAYSMGNASGYIASSMTTNKSFTFRPPIELAQQIPNANSGTLTITVYTYNGSGTLVGSTSKTIKVKVPSDIKPSISAISVSEAVSVVTNNFEGFVQNLSQLLVNISARGAQGSTISSYKTTIEGISYLGGQFTSGVIKTTGKVNISTTVTDSRGRTASRNTAITVIPYVEPSLEIAARADGNKVLVELVGSVSSVDGQNTKELTLKYKKSSDKYYSAPETIPLSDWRFDISKEMNIDASETTYEFVAVLTDKIKSNEKSNTTGIVVMSRRAGGKGITFGGEAEGDGFNVKMDATFGENVNMKKNLQVDGNVTGKYLTGTWLQTIATTDLGKTPPKVAVLDNSGWIYYRTLAELRRADLGIVDYIVELGTSGGWTYRKWNSGIAEAWRKTTSTNLGTQGTINGWYWRIYTIALPSGLFKTITDAHADCYWNTGMSFASARAVDTTNFQAIYFSNADGGAGTFYHYVAGTWK